jgi:hypothetical protein
LDNEESESKKKIKYKSKLGGQEKKNDPNKSHQLAKKKLSVVIKNK